MSTHEDPSPGYLHLVGASVRAAAQSARRAGWSPVAWDLFADADLRAIGPAERLGGTFDEVVTRWSSSPPGPWLYTGCLENHGELVGRLAKDRLLLGNGADVLRAVRDPSGMHKWLTANGFMAPELHWGQRPPDRGTWVWKPTRSGGGCRMRLYHFPDDRASWEAERSGQSSEPGELRYWQKFVPGCSCSAVYVAYPRQTCLIGATQQLIGRTPDGESPFRYFGSIGPLRLGRIRGELHRLGSLLATCFQLRGIFGVDFIRQGRRVVPLEINPRFPASSEILERATGRNLVNEHVAACRGQPPVAAGDPGTSASSRAYRYFGKSIVFARRPLTVSSDWSARLVRESLASPWPRMADIPPAGEHIGSGQPILTVFREGNDLLSLRRQLERFRLGRQSRI
jgi:uncharacterized protein